MDRIYGGTKYLEDYCSLCKEPKSVVGHTSLTCPMTKCWKCGGKGHSVKNCGKSTSETGKKCKKNEECEKIRKKSDFERNKIEWNQDFSADMNSVHGLIINQRIKGKLYHH